jgi:hypothetical protein
VLNEKVVAATQKGVVVVENGETFGEQRHAKLEIYLRNKEIWFEQKLCANTFYP